MGSPLTVSRDYKPVALVEFQIVFYYEFHGLLLLWEGKGREGTDVLGVRVVYSLTEDGMWNASATS